MENIIFEGRFNELFPKIYKYLQKYVRVRHPEYKRAPIPKVFVVYNPKIKEFARCALGELVIYLPALLSRILGSKQIQNQLLEIMDERHANLVNPGLFFKLLDSRPLAAEIVIHEYEHMLNEFHPVEDIMPKKIRLASKRTFLERKARDYISKSATLSRFLGIYRITNSQSRIIGYRFSVNEIASRLSSMVYDFYSGRNPETDTAFEIELSKIPDHIEYLKRSIKEQKSIVTKENYKTINQRIQYMKETIWYYKQILKLVPLMIEEAKYIAKEIKRKEGS